MRLSRQFAFGAAVLLVCASLASCASNQGNTGTSEGPIDATTRPVTIGIDVPFHPIFDYLMSDPGRFFAGTPYRVRFEVLDATTQVPAFGRGDLDVITTVPSFMPRIKEQYGIDTTYFFPMARWTPGPQLLVPPGSPARSIQDLAGKPVAIAPLSSRFGAEQAAVLATTGRTIEESFALTETDAAAQELALGRVQGAFLEAPATAPLLAQGYRPVFSVQDAFQAAFGDPAVMNGGFIARSDFVAANPGFVDALTKATLTAWSTFQREPDTVLDASSRVSGLPKGQLQQVAQVLNLAGTTEEQKRVTRRDVETWTKIFPLLARSGFTQTVPQDPASLFRITAGG
ncbi:MAG: ABC transporter substrate-binding protein [Pseudonocardia sp.]|nr:ABC transporter substrate-binding protein [Pseudonocardia sp.]